MAQRNDTAWGRTNGAMTISSRAAFPARSPMPFTVHSTWPAPASIAAIELATASPRSSWQCALNTTLSHDATQEIEIAAACVFGGELHVVGVAAGTLHRVAGTLEALVLADVQLVLQVNVRGGDDHVDARALGRPERLAAQIDVSFVAAGEGRDHGAPDFFRDRSNASQIAIGGSGESCLDHVDAEDIELPSEPQLFLSSHRVTGRLLAVAQRRIKNDNVSFHKMCSPCPVGPGRVTKKRRGSWTPRRVDLSAFALLYRLILSRAARPGCGELVPIAGEPAGGSGSRPTTCF